MPLFLDACALAKRYLLEGTSTTRMKSILGRPQRWGGLVVSSFVEVEVVSAIAKAAREFPNPFDRPDALRSVPKTVDTFLADYRSGAFTVVDLSPRLVRDAIVELRGTPTHNIGAADAIHLATALDVVSRTPRLVFATADQGLYEAARKHRLKVFNPNYEGEEALLRLLAA